VALVLAGSLGGCERPRPPSAPPSPERPMPRPPGQPSPPAVPKPQIDSTATP